MTYVKPHSRQRNRRFTPVEQRFWSKVEKTEMCWIWRASLNHSGYGQISDSRFGKPRLAHRLSFEMHVGAIPDGYEIDHRCRNRACVNPGHLRLATRAQNSENHIAHRGSVTGIRNVYVAPSATTTPTWRVAVGHAGKQYRGGHYTSLQEAEKAAIALRLQLHTHNEMDRS